LAGAMYNLGARGDTEKIDRGGDLVREPAL